MAKSTKVCSFCGKSYEDVKRLIAGPGVAICDECVRTCNKILSADPVDEEVEGCRRDPLPLRN
jgi:ATP-dependent Clp protease ATP-binding subunit ClpX